MLKRNIFIYLEDMVKKEIRNLCFVRSCAYCCMVHKKFQKVEPKEKSVWIDRTPPIRPRNYLDEMAPINGLIDPASEPSQRMREKFRDEVSKRMGELLLKGQTMLDEYCQTCSGIIMEDRNGARRCVTCELYEEKTTEGSHVVAQIPLEPADFNCISEAPKTATSISQVPRDYSSYSNYEEPEEIKNAPSLSSEKKVQKKKTPQSHAESGKNMKKNSEADDGITAARETVNRKLRWASQKLEEEKSYTRILEILEVLKVSAETLKALHDL